MTNAQIITGEMILNGITEEVDTFAGWKRKGLSVKRGEHAKFKTKIWKPVKSKSVKADEEDEAELDDGTKLILVNASFFTKSQVE